MVKQSRLRVQKEKKRKRALLLVLVAAVIVVAGWQINKKAGISTYITDFVLTVKKSLSGEDEQPRGAIYDRNLQQIAITLERVSAYVRIKEVESIPETVEALSAILPIDRKGVQKMLAAGPLRVWVAEDISEEQETALKKKQLPGVYLQHEKVRFYPNGTSAAHLVGYVDDNIGLAGVEYFYDRLLANREDQGSSVDDYLDQAQNLVLTIDLKIQKILEDLVSDVGGWREGSRVAAYVMEGTTGQIVGGAQSPGFNPNSFKQYPQKILKNQFLQPTVIPDKFRRFLRDAADIYSVLETGLTLYPWSVQSLKANLGCQLRMLEWLGITGRWSADFSEYDRDVQHRETSYTPFHSARHEPYGLVPEYATPLQIITALTGIFSDGAWVRPYAVSMIIEEKDGKEYQLSRPSGDSDGFGRIIKMGSKEVTQLLRSWAVPGSSGTLHFDDANILFSSSEKTEPLLRSEMLFALIPADISPLAMLVVVEGPAGLPQSDKKKQKQSLIKRVDQVVDRISVLQQVAKNVADVVEIEIQGAINYPSEKSDATVTPHVQQSENRIGIAGGVMPDLKGLSLRRSLQLLQNNNVKIRFQGTGRVVSQTPSAGTSMKGLTECILILENEEEVKFEGPQPSN
ncbi:MAG: PASTA domain-containing protein [Deltaproteobacteria bacterium]|nr:PASTA domain-containing protein [Deltaproteobacteria bacterium]